MFALSEVKVQNVNWCLVNCEIDVCTMQLLDKVDWKSWGNWRMLYNIESGYAALCMRY